MNAFFLTAWISQFREGHVSDSCQNLMVFAAGQDEARARFEEWVIGGQGNDPIPTRIEEIIVTPVLGHLFTESGPAPVDWNQAAVNAGLTLEATESNDWEHCHWVDCNQLVDPNRLSADLDSLRRELPEEIRADINWSADRMFFFLVSVLKTPPRPEASDSFEEPDGVDRIIGEADGPFSRQKPAFAELAAREVVVLIQARNSIVAAWLWRKHAANTSIAKNAIRIDPWFGAAATESI